MADDGKELEVEEAGGGKGKLMIIIIAVVVLVVGGGAAAFFMMGGEEPIDEDIAAIVGEDVEGGESQTPAASAEVGTALYVPMPRPFIFNVPGAARDRLVQVNVQLMVRGADNEETAKKHIPLIEGALLKVFSSSNADDLVTEAGKVALQEKAVQDVTVAVKSVVGRKVVEDVLFTGFVMQ